MKTRTINLRSVPEDLAVKAKIAAALQGITLKEFILRSVEKALNEADVESASLVLFGAGAPKRARPNTRAKHRKSH